MSEQRARIADIEVGFASFKDQTFELFGIDLKTGKEVMLYGRLRDGQRLEDIDEVFPTCVIVRATHATLSGADVRAATIGECAKIAGLQAFKARQSVRASRGPSARAAALAAERTAQDIQKAIIALSADTRPQADVRAARLEDFVSWVDTWVSNPIGSYSVHALDGLFRMARDKIAALSTDTRPDGRVGDFSHETFVTDNGDGSISLDAYHGKSREELKQRCGELCMALEDWRFAAVEAATEGGNSLQNVREPYRSKIASVIEAYSDEPHAAPSSHVGGKDD